MEQGLFKNWCIIKQQVDNRDRIENFFVKPRQIVWMNIGKNIGDEEDGKNEYFERPVLVIKVFNKNIFWGIPMSSKIKENNVYYKSVSMKFKKVLEKPDEQVSVIISQMRLFDTKRASDYLGYIEKEEFENIKSALRALL